MFGTWTNGSTIIPTISAKFNFSVLVINSLVAIPHKLFIIAYKTVLPLYVQ